MSAALLQKLEQAITTRNPFLAERLKPGLPEAEIRVALSRAKVEEAIEPLVEFYSWRNGTILDEEVALGKTGFFPGQIYQFIGLETALQQLGAMNQAAESLGRLIGGRWISRNPVGRYFPSFWDASTGSLCIDLRPSKRNRVVMVEFESTELVHECYGCFEEFLKDAIRANEENDTLICFQ